jgi:hypothetical protein
MENLMILFLYKEKIDRYRGAGKNIVWSLHFLKKPVPRNLASQKEDQRQEILIRKTPNFSREQTRERYSATQ